MRTTRLSFTFLIVLHNTTCTMTTKIQNQLDCLRRLHRDTRYETYKSYAALSIMVQSKSFHCQALVFLAALDRYSLELGDDYNDNWWVINYYNGEIISRKAILNTIFGVLLIYPGF